MKNNIIILVLFAFCVAIHADTMDFMTQDRPIVNATPIITQIYTPPLHHRYRVALVQAKAPRAATTIPVSESLDEDEYVPANNSSNNTSNNNNSSLIHLTFVNNTNKPASAHIYVKQQENIGYFGYPIVSHKTTRVTVPEFYWFKKVAMGGFRQPGQDSQVRLVEVLNHGSANMLTIVIPDQKDQSYEIERGNYTVELNGNDAGEIEVIVTAD